MAAKKFSGDKEEELTKKLESVLDSDCEYSEFSDDERESEECVSDGASSSDESDNDNAPGSSKCARTMTKNNSDWNWAAIK